MNRQVSLPAITAPSNSHDEDNRKFVPQNFDGRNEIIRSADARISKNNIRAVEDVLNK